MNANGFSLVANDGASFDCGPVRLVILQPTTFCNINCKYCYLFDRSKKSRMSEAVVRQIVTRLLGFDEIAGSSFPVTWHAGEPLVAGKEFYRAAFRELERLRSHCSVANSIQTNATLIDKDWCEIFREYNVHIGISLDGPRHIHDQVRVTRGDKGTHDKVMRAVDLCRTYGINPSVICVVRRSMLSQGPEILDFFRSEGFHRIAFNIDEAEGMNRSSSMEDEGAEKEFIDFVDYLVANRTKQGGMRIREVDATMDRICAPNYTLGTLNSAVVPFQIINIAWNGDYSTFSPELLGFKNMGRHRDFIFGNVTDGDFRDILDTEKFRQVYDSISRGVDECREKCYYFSVCGGGCPSNKLAENGSFASTKTVFCRFQYQIVTERLLRSLEAGAWPVPLVREGALASH